MKSKENEQEKLFYDDPYEVLTASITNSGKTVKEIASIVYPGCNLDTAKSKLSRTLSPDNHDVQPHIEMILAILDNTTPDFFVYFLCDKYGFIRPEKKKELTPEEELKLLKAKIKEMQLDSHPNFKNLI